VLARVRCGGTAPRWDLTYTTAAGGTLALQPYDAAGAAIGGGFSLSPAVNGKPGLVSVELSGTRAPGTDVDVAVKFYSQAAGALTGQTGSIAGAYTIGALTSVVVNPAAAALAGVGAGHLVVRTDPGGTILDVASTPELASAASAYTGETAAARMQRLGVEENLPVRIVGDPAAASAMGPQRPDTLTSLLRECAATDMGLLFEPRDEAGLAYRTRESLYNRAAGLTVAYHGHQLTDLEPVDDDRGVRNDVTVSRRGGSSARAVQDTGTLSVQAPPAGVGRYTETVEVNTPADSALPGVASWRLHLGTVDEARYPAVPLNLATPELANDQAQSEAVLDLDVGGRVAVTGLPAWLPPDDVSAGVQGLTETLGAFEHTITVSCVPESPYHVGVYDSTESRYSENDDAVLSGGLDTVYTFPSVASAGPLFSHSDGDFDIIVGGERMTVTAVNTTTSPQSLTVTRSVNGVVKSHLSGAPVTLFRPVFYAI
jgi:hypothetical protein